MIVIKMDRQLFNCIYGINVNSIGSLQIIDTNCMSRLNKMLCKGISYNSKEKQTQRGIVFKCLTTQANAVALYIFSYKWLKIYNSYSIKGGH